MSSIAFYVDAPRSRLFLKASPWPSKPFPLRRPDFDIRDPWFIAQVDIQELSPGDITLTCSGDSLGPFGLVEATIAATAVTAVGECVNSTGWPIATVVSFLSLVLIAGV